jgi:HSP20 family protein
MPDTAIDIKKAPPARATATVPDAWRSLRNEIDRMFDRFDRGFRRSIFDLSPFWPAEPSFEGNVPAVDVTENDKAYTITAELPGIEEKDVDVSVSDDMLTIKGEKRQEKEEKGKNYYVSERSYGSFQRSFRLPTGVDQDKASATFSKGVLTLVLPKTAEAQKQPKKIEIKAS